ncbi:MAG TPA: tetratricopeptide repeat protein [Candidatus Binatia bacterium]|nr:tetratricopeptide repeat protein [Candidatus Binatia bacterium]
MKPAPPPDEARREARSLRERGDVHDLVARYGNIDREKGAAWNDLELVHEVARAYSLAGNPAKVEQYFLRCAELNERRAALYLAQIGWYYQRKKRWGRAITWYDKALETFPTYHLCLFRKGYCLERLHRPRAAVAALVAATESYDAASPEQRERSRGIQAQVLFHLARSLREVGDTQRAREALDRCAQLDTRPEIVIKPEHRLASYGATHLRDGNADAAIACLEEARGRDGRSPVIWERLGLAYALANRLHDAEDALRRAIELPKGSVALISLARFYIAHERWADAASSLAGALERHPQGEVQIRLEIAELHRRLSRPRSALAILERLAAGRVPPHSTLACVVERKMAEILLAHGEIEAARKHLATALAHDAEDAEALALLAGAEADENSRASRMVAIADAPLPDDVARSLAEAPSRERGVVNTYFPGRGFGFIAYRPAGSATDQTIFFHVSHVAPELAGALKPGTPVTFAAATNARNGKPQAEDVRLKSDDLGASDADLAGALDDLHEPPDMRVPRERRPLR